MDTALDLSMAKKRKHKLQREPLSIGKFVKFSVIAVFAGCVAFAAGRFSLIQSMQKISPEIVQSFSNDPLSATLIAQKGKFTKPSQKLGLEASTNALYALKQDPLRTLPVRMLSIWNLDAGNTATATKLNLLSQKMTRRDLYTQIQLIGHAAEQEDVRQVLTHYDRALRVHPEAGEILFPLLANALAEEFAIQYISQFVREPAPWFDEFVRSIVRTRGPGLHNVARLLIFVGPSDVTKVPPSFVPEMIENLIGDGQTSLARRFLTASLDTPDALFRDPSINAKTTDSSLGTFGWTTNSGGGISATIDSNSQATAAGANGTVVVRVFANPNEKKMVLRRVFRLIPGTYRYSEKRDVVTKDTSSSSTWVLGCLTKDGHETIWRDSQNSGSSRSDTFKVPRVGCDFQMLELEISGGDGEAGIEFVLSDFKLQKI